MTGISEYKTQIDEVRKRLDGTSGHGGDHIDELKDRLSSVRSTLLRKQEIIESQKQEIENLRDENRQLSEVLSQALSALDAQPQGGLREVVQDFDSQISDLLGDGEPQAAVVPEDISSTEAAAEPCAAIPDSGDDGWEPPLNEGDTLPPPSNAAAETPPPSNDAAETPPPSSDAAETLPPDEGEAAWQPENDSPALRRIMGRRRR
jgi:hypothetical protein